MKPKGWYYIDLEQSDGPGPALLRTMKRKRRAPYVVMRDDVIIAGFAVERDAIDYVIMKNEARGRPE